MNRTFFQTEVGSSFTWQSLVAAIPTFKRGSIWRVGNGVRMHFRGLVCYCQASGQKINYSKTSLLPLCFLLLAAGLNKSKQGLIGSTPTAEYKRAKQLHPTKQI
jgi:hypothetical protein